MYVYLATNRSFLFNKQFNKNELYNKKKPCFNKVLDTHFYVKSCITQDTDAFLAFAKYEK